MNSIYAINHYKFFDNLVLKKRLEMASIINKYLKNYDLNSALDIGTTNDLENDSSNILIKKIKDVKIYKSISDQKITSKFFNQSLNKSITSKFTEKEILEMSSDLVISFCLRFLAFLWSSAVTINVSSSPSWPPTGSTPLMTYR